MRRRSKRIGEVPGFEACMPKKISEKAVNMLPKLIQKFMNIPNEKQV